ncbi:MAG: chromate transporter [Oscillospiraceae bacterium]|nr:chromate transporter [Oscillospiraceae bacterium]
MIYVKLMLSFLLVGVLGFGGGYAALPLIQQQCVTANHWLTMTEFSDLLALSQITPGPIAINAASFVGMKVGGITGAFIASFSFMLPPFLIVSLLYLVYRKYGQLKTVQNALSGLKPGVVGLIAVAGLGVIIDTVWAGEVAVLSTDVFSLVLIFAAFFVLRKWKPGIIVTILACGAMGMLWELARPLLR